MLQLVKQWLSTKGKPDNPIVVQFMRLDVSLFSICQLGLSAEGMAQIKGGSSHLRRSGLEEGLHTSNEARKKKIKSFAGIPSHLGFS